MKKTITATATGLALLAGGVLAAAPAQAQNLVNIDVGVGVPGWTFDGPGKPQYQYGVADSSTSSWNATWNECGGLFDVYSGNTQICSFNIDDAGLVSITAAKITFPAWKVTSPGGTTYDVAYSSGIVGNPPAWNSFTMDLFGTETSSQGSAMGTQWSLNKPGDYLLLVIPDQGALMNYGARENTNASLASEAPVGAAADVSTDADGEAPATTRSKTLTTGDHKVVAKHHTRVEKMAAKVHNQGGVLTIHAYGPDEDLAMARAREVRKHLEAQLEKRGHSGSSPIYVLYAGDPDHKKDTHATVHWHPDVNLPGAMPGAK